MDISSLKIGCVVAVTLSSSNQLIGEFVGYKEDSCEIIFKNVRFLQEEAQTSTNSYINRKSNAVLGELLVKSKNIIKLTILDEDLPKSTTSLEDNQTDEKSVVPLQRNSKIPGFNWLPGSKPLRFLYTAGVQKQMRQNMRNYCKMFFENANFAQLIPTTKNQQNIVVDIGLPKYFASFYREPVIQLETQVEPNTSSDELSGLAFVSEVPKESRSVVKNETEKEVSNELLTKEACALIVSELLKTTEEEIQNSISVKFNYEKGDQLILQNQIKTEIPEPNLSDIPQYRLSPFFRFSNGQLYLNDTFLTTLCVPLDNNDGNQTACVENLDKLSMDC